MHVKIHSTKCGKELTCICYLQDRARASAILLPGQGIRAAPVGRSDSGWTAGSYLLGRKSGYRAVPARFAALRTPGAHPGGLQTKQIGRKKGTSSDGKVESEAPSTSPHRRKISSRTQPAWPERPDTVTNFLAHASPLGCVELLLCTLLETDAPPVAAANGSVASIAAAIGGASFLVLERTRSDVLE